MMSRSQAGPISSPATAKKARRQDGQKLDQSSPLAIAASRPVRQHPDRRGGRGRACGPQAAPVLRLTSAASLQRHAGRMGRLAQAQAASERPKPMGRRQRRIKYIR
ncbi:MAG: hypothetical protein NTY37_13485 [Methanothrix sp.]|nr:hypothetical protein [Methanothrix sp.]